MDNVKFTLDLTQVSEEPRIAMQFIVNILFSEIYPLIIRIRHKYRSLDEKQDENLIKIQNVNFMCGSQLRKIVLNLMDVFKIEYEKGIYLQESRLFAFERLSWCVKRLVTLENELDKLTVDDTSQDLSEDSIFASPMYFVNWIDNTFEVLVKLADVIYRLDYKETDELYKQWKNDVVECVTGLHTCVDELLLSAMTLCRHCLPSDQHVIKARCQVVLRETKTLLTELVQDSTDGIFKVTPDTLKLPIMPSNVNILIDVLKDVLYVLETNTNTALLSLVVHSFSHSKSLVEVVRDHFEDGSVCACTKDDTDECLMVKEFDLYNERLQQIGSFAVSCSSDQGRILSLRSGLTSLEVLDPHLVPAVMMSANSHHACLLIDTWKQEVEEIKNNVFLIVDPAAFSEKSKQLMHQILLDLLNQKDYDNKNVCAFINIGCVVHDFFCIYNKCEPEALVHLEQLVPLLADVKKVEVECKIVSNILSSGEDFVYDITYTKNNKNASIDQLVKRLKLLYTLVSRINDLLHPKDNDNLFIDEQCEEQPIANKTHTVYPINATYVNSPMKPVNNISRSIFARTSNIRSSTNNFPLQHYKAKSGNAELSFSVKLDELMDTSTSLNVNQNLTHVKEPTSFYPFSSTKSRSSLRRTVLNKLPIKSMDNVLDNMSDRESLMDETMSLQITDVLNEISNMTSMMSSKTRNITCRTDIAPLKENTSGNILTLNINNQNTTISKHIWNIPVNISSVEMLLDGNVTPNTSNMTHPSNVPTLERINDLNLVESKLSSLRSMQFETSL